MRDVAIAVSLVLAALERRARPRAGDSSAQELAQALQRKYDGIKDFSADFIHTYRGGVLKKEVVERGRLLVKKPGKMRWEYTAPEEKLFVSDGVKMYSYIPQDKQVIVTSIPPDDQVTTPTMFLTGKGNLARDFSRLDRRPARGRAGRHPGAEARAQDRRSGTTIGCCSRSRRQTLQLRGLVTVRRAGG